MILQKYDFYKGLVFLNIDVNIRWVHGAISIMKIIIFIFQFYLRIKLSLFCFKTIHKN